ncbi:MAG: asparaginase [Hyphomicrobiales bacterium]
MTERRKLTYFALGGTIASGRRVGSHGAAPSISAASLIGGIEGVERHWDIDARQFMQVVSTEITLADLIRLASAIKVAIAHGAQGIVISQGTDTLEESAFALDLLWGGDEPVVMTGAMRNASMTGPDGPANLEAAFCVAGHEKARSCGVLVVINDEIHAARFVRKYHTSNPASFRSAPVGPIGWISERNPSIPLRPSRTEPFGIPKHSELPRVALVKLGLGDDGSLIEAVPDLGFAGLVIEAFGGGHVRASMMARLKAVAAVMPVVLTSRVGAGSVLRSTYDFPGSEQDLMTSGLIHAGYLDGLKARLVLLLCLANGLDRVQIADRFAAFA